MSEKYFKFSSKTGLKFLVVPIAGVESATVLVMVKTGSRDEPEKLAGISHFLEHMVFKGTEKYPSALALSSAIDSIGGEFNAFTSKEYTGFYVKAAIKHFRLAVSVLSQMLIKPLLEEEATKREKGVIVEEINMYEDLPPRKAAVLFDRLLYGDNGLGRETIGNKKTVASLTRDSLRSYLYERYTAGRVVIGVVGGDKGLLRNMRSVKTLISDNFSGLKSGDAELSSQAIRLSESGKKILVKRKQIGQAHFVLGVPALKRGHRERYALAVLSTILGGNMSSRLFSEVREKRGLAYYIRTNVESYFDTGSFTIHSGVDMRKLEEAVGVVVEQLGYSRVINGKGGITTDEINRAKEYLKGSLILDLEDSHEVADLYVRRFLLEKKIVTPKQIMAEIGRVSRDDVVRVAQRLFKLGRLRLVIVGPYAKKDEGKFEKLIS